MNRLTEEGFQAGLEREEIDGNKLREKQLIETWEKQDKQFNRFLGKESLLMNQQVQEAIQRDHQKIQKLDDPDFGGDTSEKG